MTGLDTERTGPTAWPVDSMTRRALLRRAAGLSLSASSVAALLTACGGSPATATSASPTAVKTAGGTTPAAVPPAVATGTTAPPAAQPTTAPSGGGKATTLQFDWIGDLTPLWHPSQYETFGQAVIFSLIFNNLVKLGDDLKTIVPDLAERWEVSKDATQFTFFLKKGAKWQDGAPFSAKDVVFTMTRSLLNPTLGVGNAMFESIKGAAEVKSGQADKLAGVEQLDDLTVRVTLTAPNAFFLTRMRDPENVIVPEHLLKDIKAAEIKTAPFTLKSPVGTGPYKLVQYVTDQYVEFDANPDYFKGTPRITKLFMKRLKPDVALAQLESGELDLALRLNPIDYERLAKVPTLNAISRPGVGQTSAVFATERIKDKRIRQAIYYAIDRRGIVEGVFNGRARVLSLPPGFDEYPDLDAYPYNPSKAKQLLQESGFNLNAPFRIIYDQTYPGVPTYMPIIQQHLQQVGIKAELNPLDSTAFIARLQKQRDSWEMSMANGGDEGVTPDRTSIYYSCTGPLKGSGYQNCDMDALFVQARSLADPAKRDEIYHKIAKILNDEVPQLSLWTPNDLHGASKKLGGGFKTLADPKSSFWNIETWTLSS